MPNGTFETGAARPKRSGTACKKGRKVRLAGCLPSKPNTTPGPRSQSPAASTRAAKARPGRSQPGRPPAGPKRKGTACKKRRKRDRTGTLGGCLTVPSKPTKKTCQGLAAKARAPSARPKRSGTAGKKGPKKSRTLRLRGCQTVPSKPTKKTRQGLAAKALQQAQEQLRHGQGAASQGALR